MTKNINLPIVDLRREYQFLKKGIDRQIRNCLQSQQWILGKKVVEFERKVARYLNIKYTIGVASGTDALILSLNTLALKRKGKVSFDKKDEIITTPFTFIATAEAIVRSGATAVFVDINPDTFNIDPARIKKAITKNTIGIIPVHLFGLSCQMDEIMKIAKEHNLFVIEDCAQALGGIYKGKRVGTLGDCGAFSFFPAKNLGGYGDGGLVATDNRELAELIRLLRNHGQKEKYKAYYLGYNSRLDSLQAAILFTKLRYLDRFNHLRRKIAQRYNLGLKDIEEINTPYEPQGIYHIYHLYTLKVKRFFRSKLMDFLNSKGIQARVYYPASLDKMQAFRFCKVKGKLKNTAGVITLLLSLPLHPFLKEQEVNYVVRTISSFFHENKRY